MPSRLIIALAAFAVAFICIERGVRTGLLFGAGVALFWGLLALPSVRGRKVYSLLALDVVLAGVLVFFGAMNLLFILVPCAIGLALMFVVFKR